MNTKARGINLEEDMNFCTELNGNPFSSCQNTETKISISWRPHISVKNLVPIYWVDVKVFQVKSLTCWWCLTEGLGITKYPLGTMNACSKLPGNPVNSCQDITIWTIVLDRPTNRHYCRCSHATDMPFLTFYISLEEYCPFPSHMLSY